MQGRLRQQQAIRSADRRSRFDPIGLKPVRPPHNKWAGRLVWLSLFGALGLALAQLWIVLQPPHYEATVELISKADLSGTSSVSTDTLNAILTSDDFKSDLIDTAGLIDADGFGADPDPVRAVIFKAFEVSGLSDLLAVPLPVDQAPRAQALSNLEGTLAIETSATSPALRYLTVRTTNQDLAAEIANSAADLLVQRTEVEVAAPQTNETGSPQQTPNQSTVTQQPLPPLFESNDDVERRLEEDQSRLAQLEQELRAQREALRDAELAVDQFLAEAGAPSAELIGARRMQLEQLEANAATAAQTSERLAAQVAAIEAALAADDGSLVNAAADLETASVEVLRSELRAAQRNVAQLQETLGSDHPSLLAALEEYSDVETRFREAIQRALNRERERLGDAETRTTELNQQAGDLRNTVEATQSAFNQLRALDRAASEARRDYEALLSEVDALRAAIAMARSLPRGVAPAPVAVPQPPAVREQLDPEVIETTGSVVTEPQVKVLKRAVSPENPVGPHPNNVRALGVGGGALFVSFFLMMGALRDDWLRSVDAIERASGIPVIGIVPAVNKRKSTAHTKTKKRVRGKTADYLSTSEDRVRAILEVSDAMRAGSPDADVKSIAIYATTSAKVRAHFTVDLAISAASEGIEVAVVDCDPRNRLVASTFGAHRAGDMADLLLDRQSEDSPSGETQIGGLWLFLFGTLSTVSIKQLRRDRVETAIASRMTQPGVILYDAPQPDRQTTSRAVAGIADSAVILVEHGNTRRRDLGTLIYQLRKSGAEIAGIVVTGRR